MRELQPNSVFDRDATLARVGGNIELLNKVAESFLKDPPRILPQIREAIARCDGNALERAAHELKGAVGNFGAGYAFDAALRLEMMGRNGDMSQAEEAYAELENEVTRLIRALTALKE